MSARPRTPLPTATLAQAIVRIADSFMYAHYPGGTRPEIDTALEAVGLRSGGRPVGRNRP
ncbi:QsdR family transcriptional regulator [Spirillospora sp. NPDC127200]